MKVECLDRTGIIQRHRYLRGFGRKMCRQSLSESLHFQEIAAIVGIERQGCDAYTVNQVRGGMRANHRTDALAALGNGKFEIAERRQSAAWCHGRFSSHQMRAAPSVALVERAGALACSLARDDATRLAARSSDSNVPASVHQPCSFEKV